MQKTERRATGIYAKANKLYVILPDYEIKDGVKKHKNRWICTELSDRPGNIKKAKEFREDQLYLLQAGEVKRETKIPMGKYVEHFLEVKKRLVTDTAYSGIYYRTKHISSYFENVNVTDITTKDVNDFLDYLATKGTLKNKECERTGLSKRTVKDIKVLLKSIFSQAQAEGVTSRNPVLDASINAQLARRREYHEEDTFFSYQECMRFLEGAKDSPLYELFYFTIFFGLRRSEVLGLKWSNIKLKQRKMTIASTVTKGMEIHRDDAVKTKNSHREYPLQDEQIALLNRIKDRENEDRKLFGNVYLDNDYVFKHRDGSLFYPDYPTKEFKKLIMKMPDLPQNIHFHGLRSSCVSILVHEGADVKQIQKWVGHKDIETTLNYYARVKTEESNNELSQKMSALIKLENKI